jgi:hypothetical protein
VFAAYRTFSRSEEAQQHAAGWVEWLEENWSGLYTGPQLEQQRAAAIDSFLQQKGKTTDPEQVALWNEIEEVVRRWEIG